MRDTKAPYDAGHVLVCANQREPGADKPSCGLDRATELRSWLKDRIRERGLKTRILASRTTCLQVCSAHGVTVDIVPCGASGTRKMVIVDPQADREALWSEIERCLLPPA